MQRVKTPILHQVANFFKSAFKPAPTAILIGAPTKNVPKNPSPMTPYLFHKTNSIACFLSATSFLGLFLKKTDLILSPKKADTYTPSNPPAKLAKNIIHGERPKANPAGIAEYISNVARPNTVSIFKSINWFCISKFLTVQMVFSVVIQIINMK